MKKRHFVIWVIILMTGLTMMAGYAYARENYTVRNVEVEGSGHYTDDEIVHMVMNNALAGNSLYLAYLYNGESLGDIPFIERIDVDIVSPDTVRINVYEKSVAGCVKWLGKYVYFDREGVVCEISDKVTSGIPLILGLDTDYCVLYEPLPVKEPSVFRDILTMTQLLDKNGLTADRIFFDNTLGVHLLFGDIEVELGGNDALEEVFARVSELLPKLADKKGILRMKDYSGNGEDVTFVESKFEGQPEN